MTAAAVAADTFAVLLLAATGLAWLRDNAGGAILCGIAGLILAVGGVVAGVSAG